MRSSISFRSTVRMPRIDGKHNSLQAGGSIPANAGRAEIIPVIGLREFRWHIGADWGFAAVRVEHLWPKTADFPLNSRQNGKGAPESGSQVTGSTAIILLRILLFP